MCGNEDKIISIIHKLIKTFLVSYKELCCASNYSICVYVYDDENKIKTLFPSVKGSNVFYVSSNEQEPVQDILSWEQGMSDEQ